MTPKELRARRLELGLSLSDLAERIGVPIKTVSAWERGEAPFDDIAVAALTRAPAAIRHLLLRDVGGNA